MTTKAEYSNRKENGLCLQCGGTRAEGHKSMCSRCIQKLADKYARQKQENKCVNCGEKITKGSRCKLCADQQSAQAKIRRESYKASSLCRRCGEPALLSHCEKCLLKMRNITKERRDNGLCRNCGCPTSDKSRCNKCKEINRQSVLRLKNEVFAAYGGPVCNCCGESTIEFLTVDHINNDGADHRRQIGQTSLYRWLRKNDYPKGFQILCMNCNWGKRVCGGICPHKLKETK